MDEVALWTVALATAALGLLLLAVAGVTAAILKSRRQDDLDHEDATDSKLQPQEQTDIGSDHVADGASPVPKGGGVWVWFQACVFATLHALVVSLVLGIVTFYEDIVQAHDDIQRTGRVSFPKNLLPGSVSPPAGPRLSRLEEDCSRYEVADDGFISLQNEGAMSGVTDWDVVTLHEDVSQF
jgi:hypothetical protein